MEITWTKKIRGENFRLFPLFSAFFCLVLSFWAKIFDQVISHLDKTLDFVQKYVKIYKEVKNITIKNILLFSYETTHQTFHWFFSNLFHSFSLFYSQSLSFQHGHRDCHTHNDRITIHFTREMSKAPWKTSILCDSLMSLSGDSCLLICYLLFPINAFYTCAVICRINDYETKEFLD